MLAGVTTAFEQSYTFDKVGNRLRKIIAAVGANPLSSGWTAGTTTSTYNARDQLLSTVTGGGKSSHPAVARIPNRLMVRGGDG